MLCSRNTFWPVATPVSSFANFDSDVDRLFSLATSPSNSHRTPDVEPSYRMSPTPTGATVEVELPGVAQNDIDIESTGRSITIIAKRFDNSIPSDREEMQPADTHSADNNGTAQTEVVDDKEQDGIQNSTSDRSDGSADESDKSDKSGSKQNQSERNPRLEYRLKLRLGPNYDREQITCESYRDGVLSLHIPTVPAQAPRKISIN